MSARGLACVLWLTAGCASGSIYSKGPPRRIETAKRATRPMLVATSAPAAGGAVRLELRWQTEITVERRVHFGTTELRHQHGSLITELAELPLGILMLAIPATWTMPVRPEAGQRDTIVDYGRAPMLKLVNPFTTLLSGRMRARISSRQLFAGDPVVRRYGMRLPAANADVSWRALDVTGAAVASGRVTTDVFGRAELAGLPAAAIAVEVRTRGQITVATLAGL